MAIKIVNLNKLPNAFHFETVLKTLERIAATSLAQENAGLRPLIEELNVKFQREDVAYKQSTKSERTEDIKRLDDERDAYANAMRRVAEEWAKLPDETMARDGRIIAQVFKDYQFRSDEARIAETAKLLNMFQVFDQTDKAAAIEAMGLRTIARKLVTANAQLQDLMKVRSSEQSDYIVGELRAARLEVDAAYTKVIEYLNALLIIAPSDELTQLEKVLNADLKLLDAQLAASRRRSKDDKETDTDNATDAN